MPDPRPIRVTVNGRVHERTVEPRLLLSDFLRHHLRLTGTHVGCEHGVCGACTVLVDGELARACLMLAVQADGARITTVEGLCNGDEPAQLHPVQEAFWDAHGLQCGFCTSGMLLTTMALLRDNPRPTDDEIRSALSGNLCRCTGYQNIVKAVRLAAERLGQSPLPPLGEPGESPLPLGVDETALSAGEGSVAAETHPREDPSPPPSPRGRGREGLASL